MGLDEVTGKETGVKKKSSSDAKVIANRRNARKSTGPNNTSSTRFNATKHGLLAAGLTELDDAEGYRQTLCRLHEGYAAEITAFLHEQVALQMMRLRRIARLESEYIASILHPAVYGKDPNDPLQYLVLNRPLVDPGLPASIDSASMGTLVSTFQRYESSIENRLYRALHELERIRRIQKGELLPAPVAVDVAVHSENPRVDSTGAVPILESSQFESVAHRGHEAGTQGASTNETSEQHAR
jgi:hypothetical protein